MKPTGMDISSFFRIYLFSAFIQKKKIKIIFTFNLKCDLLLKIIFFTLEKYNLFCKM